MDNGKIREIKDKKYKIKYLITNELIDIVPKAVESCMNPGTFKITPIVVSENESEIIFSIEEFIIVLTKEDINAKRIVIEEEEFTPAIIRKSGGCKPCTNCGACSW